MNFIRRRNVMKLAKQALAIALTLFTLAWVGSAQTPRSENDPRNIAPTVGTGGPVGGPTGLFTIYDGQTLRRGEYTFSVAYSNYDRDPGDVDIVEVPVSFQIGVSDHLELFFNTDAYRAMKVNSPLNLSGFRLPNSQLMRPIGGFDQLVVPNAIILAPNGLPGLAGQGIWRPDGRQPFVQYPYIGGSAGTYFPFGASIGNPIASGNGAALFPGVGSPSGSILPGLAWGTVALSPSGTAPLIFTNSPAYLPEAPFLNRQYGESAFSTFTAGAKWRWTGPNNPVGVGIIPFYRWYADKASDLGGFNQLQRGASPGGGRGDIGLIFFADARLRKWVNVSANAGYIYNSSVKAKFPTGTFTLLDRPDEVQFGLGIDFPVNKFFQPIGEVRATRYVGGRTPNALENHPIDALVGFRLYPTRWMSFGFWYRYNANEQDFESFDESQTQTVTIVRPALPTAGLPTSQTITNTFNFQDLRGTFPFSTDPHGYGMQITIGRRNARGTPPVDNKPADVTGLDVADTEVVLGCDPPNTPGPGCAESTSVGVKASATDPENDTLVYNYTVSGGRIVGQGANVNWDLSGVRPGTYTITAGVDDGCGVCGKTQTKTITVKQCESCVPPPCECPTVSVTGPSSTVNPGDDIVFTANVSGGSSCNPTYNWSVSAGTVTSGQGTPVIHVGTTAGMAGSSVTATVELGGCCPECRPTASETASIAAAPTARKVDEFGDTKHDQIRGHLDNFFVELQNDPSSHGVVIVSGPAKTRKDIIKLVNDHIKFRKVDASRIKIVDGGDAAAANTQFWVVPSGAADPM
jgi:hypothetical protein